MQTLFRRAVLGLSGIFLATVAGAEALREAQPGVAFVDFDDASPPKWQNGMLVSWRPDSTEVRVHDRGGRLRFRAAVEIGDAAAQTRVYDVAVLPDGRVLAAGLAASGAARAGFLAWIDPGGKLERVVRTGYRVPKAVCAGPGGVVWAAGVTVEDAPNRAWLWAFDSTGIFLKEVLSDERAPSNRTHPGGRVWLLPSISRVGVYSATAGEYLELDWDGGVVGRWGAAHASAAWDSFVSPVLTASGDLYATVQTNPGTRTLRLDRVLGKWQSVDDSSLLDPVHRVLYLWGADGDALVGSARPPEFKWLAPQ